MLSFIGSVDFLSNGFIAFAYFVITFEIVKLKKGVQLANFQKGVHYTAAQKGLIRSTQSCLLLIGAFVGVCGVTHLLAMIRLSINYFSGLQTVVLFLCAVVSIASMYSIINIFPALIEMMNKFEATEEGSLQSFGQSLLEIVHKFGESIVTISAEDLIITSGNRSSEAFFGARFVGSNVLDKIHPDFVKPFINHVRAVLGAESPTVKYPSSSSTSSTPSDHLSCFQYMIRSPSGPDVWVESSMCCRRKEAQEIPPTRYYGSAEEDGSLLTGIESHGALLYMLTRDISAQKNEEQRAEEVRVAVELERRNENKLRYISCTAHDLKTPLQSFVSALELLQSTELNDAQHELLRQAQVSVELMRLTISQSMDISKALTGGQLQPRRTSFSLCDLLRKIDLVM